MSSTSALLSPLIGMANTSNSRRGQQRFLSVDPAIGITGQPYAYAGDDPVNHTDPKGLCAQDDFLCQDFNLGLMAGVAAAGGAEDVTYAQALWILEFNGWSNSGAVDTLSTFAPFQNVSPTSPNSSATIVLAIATPGSTYYRYTSGSSIGNVMFATPTRYQSSQVAREELALPPRNMAACAWELSPSNATLVLEGAVASQPKWGESGGGIQTVILSASDWSYSSLGGTDIQLIDA
jgi:hypothetical protein